MIQWSQWDGGLVGLDQVISESIIGDGDATDLYNIRRYLTRLRHFSRTAKKKTMHNPGKSVTPIRISSTHIVWRFEPQFEPSQVTDLSNHFKWPHLTTRFLKYRKTWGYHYLQFVYLHLEHKNHQLCI